VRGADRADEVLSAHRKLTDTAPRELTAATVIRLAPPAPFVPAEWHGRPVVAILVCHSGKEPATDLEPLRALSDPVFDVIAERPYAGQQSLLDDTDRNGNNQYWKTEYIAGAHARLSRCVPRRRAPSDLAALVFRHLPHRRRTQRTCRGRRRRRRPRRTLRHRFLGRLATG
jgi:hypothetical protein